MNLLRIFILCLIWVFVAQPVNSQVTVTPSKKKVVIDGKSYFLHTVKQGETLYSICKAYNIPQKDVVFNNPDALEGIRIGQELRIPVKAEDAPVGNQLQSAQFIYHIAEKGQTTYWITQHYNVSLDVLYRYNLDLEHSPLQAGQVVTIPKNDTGTIEQVKPKPSHAIHTVKRKETLFSIAKSYNVDLNQILEVNPEIDANDPKIKIGQKIKIPLPESTEPIIGIPVEMSKADTIIIRHDLETTPSAPSVDTFQPPQTPGYIIEDSSGCIPTAQKDFRIAMFLPLFLADNSPASPPDSSLVKDNEGRFRYKNGQYWIHPWSVNAIEFHTGALLAIDSLKKQGLNARIDVFDTMRDTLKMEQLLSSPLMKDMDLIIGPFSTELVNQVSGFAQQNKIYYVSPITISARSLRNNPYLMQVNAGEINTVGPMVDYIAKQQDVHVTLIGNKSEFDQSLFQAYHNKLKTVFADSLLTVSYFRTDSLQQPSRYLKRKKTNVVIIPTSDEAFVNVITAQLNASAHSYHINLYGLASWTKFVNLDLEYLHSLQFRYATAFHVDYNRQDIQRFLQQYRQVYYTEPTMLTGRGGMSSYAYQFAFLGYDVTFYFASAMQRYGKGFGFCIPDFRLPMLQSDFHFTRIDPFSGYMNTRLDVYRYTKEYTVVKESME